MHNLKALVVDDSKVGRLTMQKKLETFGVGVDLAESGLEALNYLARHRPDIIFMDHMMPDLDGFEATRRIKASPATRDIPVIIVSGSDDEAFVREARAIGAVDTITKPPANEAIERILVSLPQTAAPVVGAETPSAPTPQTGMAGPREQATVLAAIKARIDEVVKQLYSNWLDEFRTRLEAEFENERQLQRAWRSRVEQCLDQTRAGLDELSRQVAAAEAPLQRLHALETKLHALEAADDRMAVMPQSWLEAVDERVAASLAELRQDAERQQARLEELRQELLHRLEDRHARDERRMHELAGRIEALSEAMQRHTATLQTREDTHSQGLEAIEQRLANLEAAASLPAVDEASRWASLQTTVDEHLDHKLRTSNEALEIELGRLRDQLQALGQSQDALRSALSARGEAFGTLMEGRFDQLRAELHAAVQSAAPSRGTTQEMAPAEPSAPSSAAEPTPMPSEVAAGTAPSALQDQVLEARLAQRLAEEWKGRWQAEMERLQRRVRTLTVVTTAGGAAMLAVILLLAL